MPRVQVLKTKSRGTFRGEHGKNLIHVPMSMHGLREIVQRCQETGPLYQDYTIGWYPNRKETQE